MKRQRRDFSGWEKCRRVAVCWSTWCSAKGFILPELRWEKCFFFVIHYLALIILLCFKAFQWTFHPNGFFGINEESGLGGKGGSYFSGGKCISWERYFQKRLGGIGVMEKKIYRRGLGGPYLILMDSEISDVSWVMGRLEKVGMVSRLDDVNLVCGRGK